MKSGKQLKYFKNTFPLIVGGAILVLIGFLIYYYSFEIWVIGTPVMAAGVVLLVIGGLLRISDANYLAYFNDKINKLLDGRREVAEPDYSVSEFSFDGNKYAKLDGGQKARSELFKRTDIFFDKKTVKVEIFSVNAETDNIDNAKYEFALADVTASVEVSDIQCAKSTKKISVMTLKAADGTSCSFPVKYNDIDVDQLVERINDKSRL
ncbi:MAG: hypothetical protein HFE63_04575 [Clostridiales bacterium]|nr:hypothetical protein [Clostridiales bacterium]